MATAAQQHATTSIPQRLTFSFDSSGWLYLYHLGVAHYIQTQLLPHLPDDRLAFSGSSGGALVACALCTKISIADLAVYIVEQQPECKYNPWRMLPCAEAAMTRFLPDDAAELAHGRLRVLLTRVQLGWMQPLVWPETVSSFYSKAKLMQVLRATCHIPVLGGLLPFRIDPDGQEADGVVSDRHEGGGYYDGLFWPSVLYTWRAFHASDTLIKVSGLGWPTAHITTQIPVPPHWVVLPPSQRMLWRLFASGYHDTARFWRERHDHYRDDVSLAKEQSCGPLPPEALAEPSRLYMLVLLALGWWQMLLLTLLFPLLPFGLALAQLLRYPYSSARSVLELLRQGMALALVVAVWPIVFIGVVVKWWLTTPAMARAVLRAAVERGVSEQRKIE